MSWCGRLFATRKLGRDIRAVWYFDLDYQTRGSYWLGTEAATRAAEDEEIAALKSGDLVALGCVLERHCSRCDEWRECDSMWGIVIAPDNNELDVFAREHMEAHMASGRTA